MPDAVMPAAADRRALLRCGSFWLATAVVVGRGAVLSAAQQSRPKEEPSENEEISPTEDLMREHGVLLRVLVVYEAAIRRLANGEAPAEPIAETARLVRSFIEDYHERLEEEYLFPRFRQMGRLTELAETLKRQHAAGRRVTDTALRLATATALQDEANRRELTATLQSFGRMYVPHMGREDTVLFPAFRSVISPREFDELGEVFERRENELFGEHGFEREVGRIADIEKTMGVSNLAEFTPH